MVGQLAELTKKKLGKDTKRQLRCVIEKILVFCNCYLEMLKQTCELIEIFFVAAPTTSQAGLHSIVTVLPCTNYETEVLDSQFILYY